MNILDDELISEWVESLEEINQIYGKKGIEDISQLMNRYLEKETNLKKTENYLNTDYVNTIPSKNQIKYPGDIELEERIENIIRWNAAAMVLKGVDNNSNVGGHIATFSSASTILEVGFNHFFRSPSETYTGDLVIPQPHASPGIYARSFLEGRLSEEQLKGFRRELHPHGGLSAYPHPFMMPDYWQIPSASMGLSTPIAIYQAKFAKYLQNRDILKKKLGKVWAIIGDGETDEPEVLGSINAAAREKLDNLILIINCNLQRLDGPVRGNSKIIQELERTFRGAGWEVIKVIWGSEWDDLLEKDLTNSLKNRMNQVVDGEYQWYSTLPGAEQRKHWVGENHELNKIMNSLTDEELKNIKRGGHDRKKLFTAFNLATKTKGKPTVLLIKTVKGEGFEQIQGQNTAHQQKKINIDQRAAFARKCQIDLTPEQIANADFYRPSSNSKEIRYILERRKRLGGFIPLRTSDVTTIKMPDQIDYFESVNKTRPRATSSTAAAVKIITKLTKDSSIGKYIVPIVPDEARTFGLETIFRGLGIYSQEGQNYTPVDIGTLTPYKEAKNGQVLQEGICETGAMSSFMAAGTAHSIHKIPMIPFYLFYSMFGFQRVGDLIWACGDILCKGFLLGGTAGRTTLNGEGLQHQDGHSHVIAETVPNLKSYDPAFDYELVAIIYDGIEKMFIQKQNIFYYLTVYNQKYEMPELPSLELKKDINKGGYCLRKTKANNKYIDTINILASGPMVVEALDAESTLIEMGFSVNIFSITSFNELYRNALEAEQNENMTSHIEVLFKEQYGIFIAITDYQKSLPLKIAKWIEEPLIALGTDGFGLSETRENSRDFFKVNSESIVEVAIKASVKKGTITSQEAKNLSGIK
ncbi:MAG: pyruvate dehydrogenase (acetyl-transferring), homodimeric type [Methylococcaceae bacterium TMED69]|nr:MAG: pyruvate dehydrogenase (acetyl-transferring), homodimeric type [Methylococcaceae bacterium TMED69]